MTITNNSISQSTPLYDQPVESNPSFPLKKLPIAISIIIMLGGLVAFGTGLAGLGVSQGWWFSATLVHLGGVNSSILMIVGAGVAITSFIIVTCFCSKQCVAPQQEEQIVDDNHPTDPQSDPQLIMIKEGLQRWVNTAKNAYIAEKYTQAAIRILDCYQNQSHALDLAACGISILPQEIYQLKHLESLNLTLNHLTTLPQEMSKLVNLEHLDLTRNNFESFPNILYTPSLRSLNLSCNAITNIHPEINQLTKLRELNLDFNDITSLPHAILDLPRYTSIHLYDNPFSFHVIENLQQTMNNDSYSGPRITFSMRERDNQQNQKSLEELLDDLFKAACQPPLQLSNLCAIESDKENLRNWLSRLSYIGDYRANKRKELAVSIYRALEKAEKQDSFREIFWNCIKDAHETCGDRMALSLLYLDLQFEIAECQDIGRLAYLLGHGTWALSELEKIAGNKVRSLNFVDEIEVYLAYPIKLKDELQLPIALDSMLYFGCSSVTDKDLRLAGKIVKDGLSNKETYCDNLVNNGIWQKALAKEKPKEYAEIQERRDDAAANATSDKDYKVIERKFKKELADLTFQVLKQVGSPPFLV